MNDLEKEFVPYQQSLDMKELGFDEPCFTSYDNEGKLRNPFDYSNSEPDCRYIEDSKHFVYNSELTIDNFNGPKYLYTQFIAAPTFSQAFRFFRENYKLNAFIRGKVFDGYIYEIDGLGLLAYKFEVGGVSNASYEQVELDALNKLIEIVKSGSLKA